MEAIWENDPEPLYVAAALTVNSSPGAQIIDLMMLVIDVTKGMQTQSAECLVIGQIACQKMVVVLNKIDLLPEAKRQSAIEKMTKKMQKTLENTKWVNSNVNS